VSASFSPDDVRTLDALFSMLRSGSVRDLIEMRSDPVVRSIGDRVAKMARAVAARSVLP
jgi:hypothetical protein